MQTMYSMKSYNYPKDLVLGKLIDEILLKLIYMQVTLLELDHTGNPKENQFEATAMYKSHIDNTECIIFYRDSVA